MSYSSLAQQSTDQNFLARINSCVQQEAWNDPSYSETPYGKEVRAGRVYPPQQFAWPVSLNTEAAYWSALISENPDPGGDPTVVTDQAILSSVQAVWPMGEWPPSSS